MGNTIVEYRALLRGMSFAEWQAVPTGASEFIVIVRCRGCVPQPSKEETWVA